MMYQIFGDAPAIKILDWMIENQESDHSTKEIADGAGLSMGAVRQNIEPALINGVVVVNRTVGRYSMYVLDMQNKCTKAIIEFDGKIAKCCESSVTEDASADVDATEEPIMILPPEM